MVGLDSRNMMVVVSVVKYVNVFVYCTPTIGCKEAVALSGS